MEAEVICGSDREGYDGHVHGGIIASLLDGAMTNCLFSHGIRALTGELAVRMIRPIQAETSVVARAWLERRQPPLYLLKAELRQEGRLAAKGEAKFMRKMEERFPETETARAFETAIAKIVSKTEPTEDVGEQNMR